ncbi:unnamed protein product [Phytomonas sp. Hart1]|nr:unnamed protein product [Phytomonas sp. Hart1]|eukprot:CCW69590.1 unnamed protein product [Phytomonas sp. isolate Hart1]
MWSYQHVYCSVGGRIRGRARQPVLFASFGNIRDPTRRGALSFSFRHQITAPTKVYFRGWREKSHLNHRSMPNGQGEVNPRSSQPHGFEGGIFSLRNLFHGGRRGGGRESYGPTSNVKVRTDDVYCTRGTLAAPRYTFWQHLRRSSRNKMPLNPLHKIKKWDDIEIPKDPTNRSTTRFLMAIEEMFGKAQKRGEEFAIHLSEDQRNEILMQYISTKWWGRLYYPFRNITDKQIRWSSRIAHVLIVVFFLFTLVIILFMYFQEVRIVELLSPEDRRDYIHIMKGMRISEVQKLNDEVLTKEDPLMALSPVDRCRLFIEAARLKNWHRIDWEVESRNRYPNSALDDLDYYHLIYWMCMTVGSVLTGGSTYFTDTFGLAERTKKLEAEFASVELDPKALPESNKPEFCRSSQGYCRRCR